jgi:hypothetical protein
VLVARDDEPRQVADHERVHVLRFDEQLVVGYQVLERALALPVTCPEALVHEHEHRLLLVRVEPASQVRRLRYDDVVLRAEQAADPVREEALACALRPAQCDGDARLLFRPLYQVREEAEQPLVVSLVARADVVLDVLEE